ncbi:YHYH protein [Roseobacter weihaiensis]|uniref:YHYH protein n=1 Tax=Roseobacter weihaiensis TaxID=2763262 RepID=UPI001D0BB483|nr:YHYH protein [Roseobacter sp. H9]
MQSGSSITSIFLTLTLLSTSVDVTSGAALAHGAEDHCGFVIASVEEAGFSDVVTVTCENGTAVISSNMYPDHELMTGIVGTNEQVPVPALDYNAPIPLAPVLGNTPQTRDAALGVAVNGVPIFDYTGGGEMTEADLYHHQTQHDTLQTQQLDVCGGHAGRGDDYHYHVKPICMIAQMENAGHSAIIGWAFDGFPIYGDTNPDGTAIPDGVLDVCNGQPDETFGYRYHTSEGAPYIVQCLMGEVADIRELPRISPLVDAETGRGVAPGHPPHGGVENLVFTEGADGTRSMDYSYEDENYYIRYTPSDTPDCYLFKIRTVTNGGDIVTGEYCR